ncbi:MAG TPA: hypothetical protein VF838_00520 [Trebonia sp.]
MERLSLGVCGTSRKENERRLPVHPLHLERIEPGLRARVFLERGSRPDRRPAGDSRSHERRLWSTGDRP